MLVFLALTAWIVYRGVEKGIEKLQNKEILEKGDLLVVVGGAKKSENGKESKTIGGVLKI